MSKKHVPAIHHGKWVITCTNGLWEAKHTEADIYVNFSQEPDRNIENLKRILDSPALRREQDARVLKRLLALQDYINSRLVFDPVAGENFAKEGEEINVGRALCEVKDNRLFALTSAPEKYLELDQRMAQNETKLRAALELMTFEAHQQFFNQLPAPEIEHLALHYGIKPSDYGITYAPHPTILSSHSFGSTKSLELLHELIKNFVNKNKPND